jgi:branched-subunit amino acid ABC-type transport system permease component
VSRGVLLQAVLTGLSVGAVYGLVGQGFALVHRLTRVMSLAHGDLVVAAAFLGVLTVVGRGPVASTPGILAGAGLALAVLAAGAGLSVGSYLLAVRPFVRSGDVLGWLAGTAAAGLLLREAVAVVFPEQGYAVPDPLRLDRLTATGVLALPGDASLPVRTLGVLLVAVVAAVVAERCLVGTRLGHAMRAVADDADAARLSGIPVERVVLLAFAVAGLLAGLAGVLDAPGRTLTPAAGVVLGLKGIAAAAVLGRLGSLRGALAGGLALGVVEQIAVASSALGPEYVDVLPLAILVAVLVVRPPRASVVVE